jgi:hypothetical protein
MPLGTRIAVMFCLQLCLSLHTVCNITKLVYLQELARSEYCTRIFVDTWPGAAGESTGGNRC